MSEKKLLSIFMEKMVTDEGFASKVASVQTPENLIELAKTLDVALSVEQAEKGLVHVQQLVAEDSNLEDNALEEIAGGMGSGCKLDCKEC